MRTDDASHYASGTYTIDMANQNIKGQSVSYIPLDPANENAVRPWRK